MKVGTDGVLLGAWAEVPERGLVLDAGAGSGLIALMLAQRADCRVTAVEADHEAAACCCQNVANSPFSSRIEVVTADIMAWKNPHRYDLIVSNPPFFAETLHSPDARRASARHASDFSPVSLIELATEWLADDGRLAMIIPSAQEVEVTYAAEMHRLKVRRICYVSTVEGRCPERVMMSFARIDGPIERSVLTLRDRSGVYTQQFINLTNQFYLRYSVSK